MNTCPDGGGCPSTITLQGGGFGEATEAFFLPDGTTCAYLLTLGPDGMGAFSEAHASESAIPLDVSECAPVSGWFTWTLSDTCNFNLAEPAGLVTYGVEP